MKRGNMIGEEGRKREREKEIKAEEEGKKGTQRERTKGGEKGRERYDKNE